MEKALQTMIDNMPDKTGKSLAQWFDVLSKVNIEKHGEAVKFLKTEHNVTHGFANTIVTLFKQQDKSEVDLVAQQYQGKESLLPIYHLLLEKIAQLADNLTITPKKASVSFIHKKQFVLVKPSTKTRIDIGLKLTGHETTERLLNSGPFGTMCTHRVQVSSITDVDEQLIDWISQAYHQAG